MDTVTVSPKFQVVVPKAVRRELGLQPGDKLHVTLYDRRIEMIPARPLSESLGLLAPGKKGRSRA